jgi:polysaccharide biosynthesis/export protein
MLVKIIQNHIGSLLGVALKSRLDSITRLGLPLVFLSGTLFGQASLPPGQTRHSTPTTTVTSSPVQSSALPAKTSDNGSFIIGDDDGLAISVWKEPDLSRTIQVRSDGKISLPLIGEVQATGRTPLELEQDISTKLQNYIAKPEVTVMVTQINSKKFNILGQVARPGSYSLSVAPTVMDAIAAAGGLRDFAKQKNIYILRQNAGGSESRITFNYKEFIKGKDLNQNIKLEPHDTVVVP